VVPFIDETVQSTTHWHTKTLKFKRYRSVTESDLIQIRNPQGDHRIKQLYFRYKIQIQQGIMLANRAD